RKPAIIIKRRANEKKSAYAMTAEDVDLMGHHTSETASSVIVDHPRVFTFVFRGNEGSYVLHQQLLLVGHSDGIPVSCQPFVYPAFKTTDPKTSESDVIKFRKSLLKHLETVVVEMATKTAKERKSLHCVLTVRGCPTDKETKESWTVNTTLWFYESVAITN